MTSLPPQTASSGRTLALALYLSAAVFGFALARREPPSPKPFNAPAGEFSAGRARQILEAFAGDGQPHPQGSEANAGVRKGVIAELTRLGYEPSLQETFACGRYGTCGTVKNVLASLPGTAADAKAVLLCAHYDSVGAGPGASDDGMGVAALLEVARILKASPPLRNPVIFLIDDGEESGLLGAEAFAAEHPWARQIGAVVNLEARGTSGASLLFETSENNLWLARLAARALPRPNTSSVFDTVYKRMPNDTDLTVFREKGMAGVNFACVGDVAHYHTPLDNVENASAATLQHHGDNALTMVRVLGNADLETPPAGNAVFFDVFGFAVVWWPEGWTPGLAALAVLLLLLVIGLAIRRGDLSWRSYAWGLAGGAGMVALPVVCALAATRVLAAAGAFPANWVAHPLPPLAGFWLMAFFGSWLAAASLSSRASQEGLWAGVWTWWAVPALPLSLWAPGAGYLFLIPVFAAALTALPRASSSAAIRPQVRWQAFPPILLAVFFWLPIAWFLYDGLGVRGVAVISALVALVAGTFAPLIASLARHWRRRLLLSIGACSVAAFVTTLFLPAFSTRQPERANILWHQDADTGKARWLYSCASGALPATMRDTATFGARPAAPFPWSVNRKAFAAAAAHQDWRSPELAVLERSASGGRRRIRARLTSPRGAPAAGLAFPPSVRIESLAMGGKLLPRLHPRVLSNNGGWRVYSCVTLPPEGVEIEAVLEGEEPVEVVLTDQSPGLPQDGAKVAAARPPTAVPSYEGDLSFVTRRVRL